MRRTYAAKGRSAARRRLFDTAAEASYPLIQAQDALLSDAGYDSLCLMMFGATEIGSAHG